MRWFTKETRVFGEKNTGQIKRIQKTNAEPKGIY